MPVPILQRRMYDNSGESRMADLLRMRGEIEANSTLQQGQASAQMWSNIGRIAGDTMGDIVRYQQDEPRRKLLEAETEARTRALGEAAARKDVLKMVADLPPEQQVEELRRAGFTEDADRIEDRAQSKGDRADAKASKTIAELHQRLNSAKTIFGRGAAILSEAQKNPTLWPEIRPQVADLAGSLDPALAEMIPQEYEPDQVAQIIESTTKLAEQYGQAEQALNRIDQGLKGVQAETSFLAGAAALLATTDSPETWDGVKQTLKDLKVPDSVLSRFGEFTPENLAKATAIVRPAPPKADGFTLAPGARRYDAAGNLIAAAPERPERGEGPPKDDPALPVGVRNYLASLIETHQGDYTAAEAEWNRGLAEQQRKHPRLDPGKARSYLQQVFGFRPPSADEVAMGDATSFRAGGFEPGGSMGDMLPPPQAPSGPMGAGTANAAPPPGPPPGAPPAGGPPPVPPEIAQAFADAEPGTYELNNGEVWRKTPDGNLMRVQ